MDRKQFEDELCKLLDRCEASEPTKACSLLLTVIGVCDRWSLDEFQRLATLEEITGVLRVEFARVRAVTGTAALPRGGLQS